MTWFHLKLHCQSGQSVKYPVIISQSATTTHSGVVQSFSHIGVCAFVPQIGFEINAHNPHNSAHSNIKALATHFG